MQSFLNCKGKKTAEEFHKELGKELYDKCGLLRTKEGLEKAIKNIRSLREEYKVNLLVPGTASEVNSELEKAGR